MSKNHEPVYVMVRKSVLHTIIIVLVTLFLMSAGSLYFTVWSAQRWCTIINLFDDGYKKAPPTNPTGKVLAPEFRKLRSSYRC